MSNIKKLDCPFKRYEGEHEWYQERNEKLTHELKTYYKEVTPLVGTDGWYYQGGKCWYEFEGKAYSARAKDFLYSMRILDAGEHSVAEYTALRQLDRLNSSLLTKDQQKFLFYYGQHIHFKKMKAKNLVKIKNMKKRLMGK